MADGSNSTMSEGDPPVAAQVVSGHLEMPGHLEMTPGQSPMETEEPSARTRRRADEAEIAERGTPPKRPPPPDGNEGHLEMTGHLEMPQGGKKQLRQLSWRETVRFSSSILENPRLPIIPLGATENRPAGAKKPIPLGATDRQVQRSRTLPVARGRARVLDTRRALGY